MKITPISLFRKKVQKATFLDTASFDTKQSFSNVDTFKHSDSDMGWHRGLAELAGLGGGERLKVLHKYFTIFLV